MYHGRDRLFVMGDGFVVHHRHLDYDRSHGGAFVLQNRWRWTEIDRFEFVIPKLTFVDRPAQFEGRYWKYSLCAWPTEEYRRTRLGTRNPQPERKLYEAKPDPYHHDISRDSVRIRLSQVKKISWNDRAISHVDSWNDLEKPEDDDRRAWFICGSEDLSRRQWRRLAWAVRRRTQGRLTLETSFVRKRFRWPG